MNDVPLSFSGFDRGSRAVKREEMGLPADRGWRTPVSRPLFLFFKGEFAGFQI